MCDCGGIWFDVGELTEWARTRKLNRPVPSGAYGAPFAAEPSRCPRCAVPALQSRVLDGVHFARCSRCQGIWLTPEGVARMNPASAPGPSRWSEVCCAFLEALVSWP